MSPGEAPPNASAPPMNQKGYGGQQDYPSVNYAPPQYSPAQYATQPVYPQQPGYTPPGLPSCVIEHLLSCRSICVLPLGSLSSYTGVLPELLFWSARSAKLIQYPLTFSRAVRCLFCCSYRFTFRVVDKHLPAGYGAAYPPGPSPQGAYPPQGQPYPPQQPQPTPQTYQQQSQQPKQSTGGSAAGAAALGALGGVAVGEMISLACHYVRVLLLLHTSQS